MCSNYEADFDKIADSLHHLAENVANVEILDRKCIRMLFKEISTESIDTLYNDLHTFQQAGKTYIYIISLLAHTKANQCYTSFDNVKRAQYENRAYARLNKHNKDSECLYIGSSSNLAKRIKEHLGYGSKQTYALQMKYWARDLPGGVQIEILTFTDSVAQNVVQAIEDGLWSKYKPMFGRQGAR